MAINITITIDENGQIILPLEANQYMNLQDRDWLKVRIQPNEIVIIPPKALDKETVATLIHAGILIESKPND